MGILGDTLKHAAKVAGELGRIKRTEKQEKKLDPQSKKWLDDVRQKANNGNADAMFTLGFCYYKGKYVGYDPDQVCHWWTEAAKLGDTRAQYNLGLLYLGDLSTLYNDEIEAIRWLSLAAKNGEKEAYKVLTEKCVYDSERDQWILK